MHSSDNRTFIQSLTRQVQLGYGFVPFVGSGLSQASGIITAKRFDALLIHSLHLCCNRNYNLAIRGWPAQPNPSELDTANAWVHKCLQELYAVFLKEKKRREELRGPSQLPFLQHQNEAWLREHTALAESLKDKFESVNSKVKEGLGLLAHALNWKSLIKEATCNTQFERDLMGLISLHDWRATLTFLASLHYQQDRNTNILTGQIKPYIIDRFNRGCPNFR